MENWLNHVFIIVAKPTKGHTSTLLCFQSEGRDKWTITFRLEDFRDMFDWMIVILSSYSQFYISGAKAPNALNFKLWKKGFLMGIPRKKRFLVFKQQFTKQSHQNFPIVLIKLPLQMEFDQKSHIQSHFCSGMVIFWKENHLSQQVCKILHLDNYHNLVVKWCTLISNICTYRNSTGQNIFPYWFCEDSLSAKSCILVLAHMSCIKGKLDHKSLTLTLNE